MCVCTGRTMFHYNVGRYADLYTSSIRNFMRYSLNHCNIASTQVCTCVGPYAGPRVRFKRLLRTRGRARLATTSHTRPTREHPATTSHNHARLASWSSSSLPCARSVFVRFGVGGAAWTVPEPHGHCLRCTGRDGGGRCGRGRVVLPRRARRMRRERGRRAAAGRHARTIVCARAARRRSCWNISRVTSYIRGPLAQRYSLNFMPTVSTDCVARVA